MTSTTGWALITIALAISYVAMWVHLIDRFVRRTNIFDQFDAQMGAMGIVIVLHILAAGILLVIKG